MSSSWPNMWPDMRLPGRCQSHSRASVIRVIHTHTHRHTYKNNARTAGSAYFLLIPYITRFTLVPFESMWYSHARDLILMIHFIQFTHSLYDKCDQCDSDDEQSGTTNNYNAFLAAVWIELHCFVSTGFVPWEGMEGGMGGVEGQEEWWRRPRVASCFQPRALN